MARFFDDKVHIGNGVIVFHSNNEWDLHHSHDHENTCGEDHKPAARFTVLLVDAGEEIHLLAHALRGIDCRVFLVDLVRDAIAVLAVYRVDLVLVNDASSGNDAGFIVCAEMNRIVEDCRPRVLMLTSGQRSREALNFVGVDYQFRFDMDAKPRRKSNQLEKLMLAVKQIFNSGCGQELNCVA